MLATWGIVVADALLGLLMFGGPVTIYAIFSIGKFSAVERMEPKVTVMQEQLLNTLPSLYRSS